MSASSARAIEDYRLAPPAPQLAAGLPLAQRVNGGVWLPAELAHGLHVYSAEFELYPMQCQSAMDALADVVNTQAAEQHRLDTAEAQAASDKRAADAEAHRFTLARAATVGGVGLAIGIIAGLVAARH